MMLTRKTRTLHRTWVGDSILSLSACLHVSVFPCLWDSYVCVFIVRFLYVLVLLSVPVCLSADAFSPIMGILDLRSGRDIEDATRFALRCKHRFSSGPRGALFKTRAFVNKARYQRFCDAEDYTDEWSNQRDDNKQDMLRVYYVCLAGFGGPADNKCFHVIRSALDALHTNPLATVQPWYCKACGQRYQPKMGS